MKKTSNYYFGIIMSIILGLVIITTSVSMFFYLQMGIIFLIFSVGIGLICFMVPFVNAKIYKRQFSISNGQLEFTGRADLYSVVGVCKKQPLQSISIPSVSYIFITRFVHYQGRYFIVEKEKVNDKNEVMGYMYLLSKFFYDKDRCREVSTFEFRNRLEDYKSQFYEPLCSMCYQKEVLNELLFNGFKGEIYILSAIYQPRKQDFDNLFLFYLVPKEKIHIVA